MGEREIAAGLAVVGADRLVDRLLEGLETIVGETGAILLAGGERQRLALARVLLRKPNLLIMDEATSAIDPDNESALLEQLRMLQPRPMVVTIANRFENLA